MQPDRLNRWRYSLYAPIYDRLAAVFTATRRRAVEQLALRPGERVLIVGCGTGLDLEFIPPTTTVSGIDVSPGMLARAQRRAERLGHGADLRVGDARELPWPDAAFDVIVLHFILAVAPEPERIAREAARVLRPGGRVSILDKFVPAARPPSLLRRALNLLTHALFSDINRSLEPMLDGAHLRIMSDVAVGTGGLYRLVRAEKPLLRSMAEV
jgi:phosphatidylethanolamine/phosphatidyl-N-methylethanolamine N-methyltransferase